MSNTIWNSAVDGDWTDTGDWSGGIPTLSKNAVINAIGAYTVTISSAVLARSLIVDDAGATLMENSGGHLETIGLTIDAGTVVLNNANSIENIRLIGGTLELGHVKAQGNSEIAIDGGALIGTATESIANTVNADGTFTLAAGHGDTVRLTGNIALNMNGGGTINFGQSGDDGLFVWKPLTLGVANGGTGFSVDVNAGTLRDGNGSLNGILDAAQSLSIAAGAKISISGHSETVHDLSGAGTISSGVDGGQLTVDGGDFSGIVNGFLAVSVEKVMILTGVFAQTNGTTIENGASLFVEGNGAVRGNIVDDGFLQIDRTVGGTPVFSGIISGTGSLQLESGSIALDGINTYSGGTILSGGMLEIGNAAALGTGPITLDANLGVTLLATATASLSNQLAIDGDTTFLATHGTTLTLNTGAGWSINNLTASIVFGSSTNDGVIVWDTPSHSTTPARNSWNITIAGGTLRAGDGSFQLLLDATGHDGSVYIARGGTLDVAGFTSTIYDLTGTGTLKNSGAPVIVTLNNSDFSGNVVGLVALDITGITALGGNAANWSVINLLPNSELKLESASSTDVVFFSSNSTLSFDDLSEFTGTVANFAAGDQMLFPTLNTGLSVSYSGDIAGGTLTVSSSSGSAHIALRGDYTHGTFSTPGSDFIVFTPNAPITATHVDSFDLAPHRLRPLWRR